MGQELMTISSPYTNVSVLTAILLGGFPHLIVGVVPMVHHQGLTLVGSTIVREAVYVLYFGGFCSLP